MTTYRVEFPEYQEQLHITANSPQEAAIKFIAQWERNVVSFQIAAGNETAKVYVHTSRTVNAFNIKGDPSPQYIAEEAAL